MNKQSFIRTLTLFVVFLSLVAAPMTSTFAQTGVATAKASSERYSAALTAIEQKVEARRGELGIPGMSLAIVKDGEVIYMKGLGYKDFEKKVPVTPDTQFAIASATKAFTGLSVLIAQDEGKVSLDDKPKKFLPYFRMYDPETDAAITVRDLLSHSSGLNRTDLAMVTGKLNRSELIEVAAQAKPIAKLRERFLYQNLMFTAAGEIVAAVEKKPWEKVVPEKILKPLGMTNTTMSVVEMEKSKDYSFGYNYNFDTKETRKLPYRSIDETAPAGSMNSSARDMSRWLRFILADGELDGKRIVSEASFAEWIKPQMKISPNGSSAYGLGWFIQDWKGKRVVQHGGNIDGFNSMVAMIPEEDLGFVMLTNVSASSLGDEMMEIVFGNLVGGTEKKADAAEGLEQLVGKYRLAAAGIDVDVKLENGKLVMTVPGQQPYTLEPLGGRKFKPAGAPEGFGANFSPATGEAAELELIQPGAANKLARIAADGTVAAKPKADAPAVPLKELVGQYSTPDGNGTLEVKETDGKVMLNIAGQQPYELKPNADGSYALSPLPESFSLRGNKADGAVTSISITQPQGTFEFKRKAAETIAITVDELFAKVVDALGGEANLNKIKTRVTEANLDLENQGVKATAKIYAKAPNKTATETTMTALGKTIATGWDYFDGTTGEQAYSFAPAEKYTGKRLADIAAGADFAGILNWKAHYKSAEIKGTRKIGDEETYVVTFESKNGTNITEYISKTTFLPVRRDGVIASSTSSIQIPYTTTFEDYREVDGVMLPFRSRSYTPTNGNVVVEIKSVKHNVEIKDELFKPRKVS